MIWEGKLKHFYQPEQLSYLRVVGIYHSVIRAVSPVWPSAMYLASLVLILFLCKMRVE